MKFSLCIPMYNEASIIEETAKSLSSYLQTRFESYEILFSDDGSTDGSGELVRALNLPNVRVIGYEKNRGKGCAVRTAMLEATGDVIMFTDADLAYGTEVVGRVADCFESHPESDLVLGSRNLSKDGYEGYTWMRKVASKAYIRVLCLVGGFRLSDSQCGCKAFRATAAKEIFSRCTVDGFAFDFEAILWAQELGKKITELPVRILCHRESKIRLFRDAFKMLADLNRMKKRIRKESKKH